MIIEAFSSLLFLNPCVNNSEGAHIYILWRRKRAVPVITISYVAAVIPLLGSGKAGRPWGKEGRGTTNEAIGDRTRPLPLLLEHYSGLYSSTCIVTAFKSKVWPQDWQMNRLSIGL